MALRLHRKTKLDPYLDQIGIITDAELAAMAGVTPENVRAYRTRRGIPARWRGERQPGAGAEAGNAVVDAAPAAPAPRGHKRSRVAAPKSETVGADLGDDLAVTDSIPEADSVEGFGIPVDVEVGMAAEEAPVSRPTQAKTSGAGAGRAVRSRQTKLGAYLDRLGLLPDAEVAALAGVTAENVRTYRKRRGIPARWRGESQKETSTKGADGRRGKLMSYKEQIGVLPDARIAALAGTSPANVRAWRLRHDVPARWRGEGDPLPNEAAIRLLDEGRPAVESKAAVPAVAPPPRPAVTAQVPRVASALDGYEVTVEPSDTWLVVARDIGEAAQKAMASLAVRGIEGRVLNLRFVARLLEG